MNTAASAPSSTTAAPAPSGAPAGAPAAPGSETIGAPSPSPAPTPGAPAPQAPAAVSYAKTGDAGLDMALGFVGKLGIGPEDSAMKAAENGDFGQLKAKLAALGAGAQGWEQYVALAEESHKKGATEAAAKHAADTAAIHEAVGGEDNWKTIKEWAGANAEPAERDAVNAAFKQGGLVAKVMAQWLAGQHAKASGTVVTPASAVKPGASPAPAPANGAMTARQYSDAVSALRTSKGYGFESSPEYKQLQTRRLNGQRKGI